MIRSKASLLRAALIGNGFDVRLARMQPMPARSRRFAEVIAHDVRRCFPDHRVHAHNTEIQRILECFSATHYAVGYCQGMNFVAVALFSAFYDDDPQHAGTDTLYALPRMLRVCLPLYPMHKKDGSPTRFVAAVAKCIGNHVDHFSKGVEEYTQVFLLHFWPALFGNLFALEDTVSLLVFLTSVPGDRQRYSRLFAFTVEMLRPYERAFTLGGPEAISLVSDRHMHNVSRITRAVEARGTWDHWLGTAS